MVINEKALVREMKEAYKGWGYLVTVMPGDKWVISREDAWCVQIEGQGNVPNEVLSLIVLHMGRLPRVETAYKIYKGDDGPVIQKEVYAVAAESWRSFEQARQKTNDEPVTICRTSLVYGSRRVWQQKDNGEILLIDPRYEGLIERSGGIGIRAVGQQIYAEGDCSCIYVSRARGGAKESLVEHLEKVQWT